MLVTAAAVVAGGCSSQPAARGPLPPPPQIVDVTITEFHFAYNPVINAGRVVFVGHNAGHVAHTMRLFPIDDSVPPVDAQLHGTKRIFPRAFGGTRVRPGTSNAFAVQLVHGQRYFMLDLDRGPDGSIYALKGLDTEFRAR